MSEDETQPSAEPPEGGEDQQSEVRTLADVFRDQQRRSGSTSGLTSLDSPLTAVMRAYTADMNRRLMPKLRLTTPGYLGVNQDVVAGLRMSLGIDSALKGAVSNLSPKFDLNLATKFDWGSFAPKLSSGATRAITDLLRRWLPPNWRPGTSPDQVIEVVQNDGIPLVWVPRAEIVDDLLAAPNRDTRVTMLVQRGADITQDCLTVLGHIDDEALTGQLPLALRAVEAVAAGHHEAGQALAVMVADRTITQNLRGVKPGYNAIRDAVLLDPAFVPFTRLRLHAAFAPIHRFLTPWRPGDPEPRPTELSRHVSVHQADAAHFTEGNAVIAIMLMTSLLRAVQELHAFEVAAGEGAAA